MKGRYSIEVYDNRVHYFLEVKRNITIIQGDSATGKTELVRLIEDHENNGPSSGVTLICEKECAVIGGAGWKQRLEALSDCIIFIDENENFVKTSDFSAAVKGSSNYFVICNRDGLAQLPYSMEEIYGLRQNVTSRYRGAKRVYNETFKLYPYNASIASGRLSPDLILTEDSNSGFDFYQKATRTACASAGGKDQMLPCLKKNQAGSVLAIVDGAAFGPEIAAVMRYISDSRRQIILFAPESFEYLLLKSDFMDHLSQVTSDTWKYVDSSLYMSWEQFFTSFLQESTNGTVYHYSKERLNPVYLTKGILQKIRNQLPPPLQGLFPNQK